MRNDEELRISGLGCRKLRRSHCNKLPFILPFIRARSELYENAEHCSKVTLLLTPLNSFEEKRPVDRPYTLIERHAEWLVGEWVQPAQGLRCKEINKLSVRLTIRKTVSHKIAQGFHKHHLFKPLGLWSNFKVCINKKQLLSSKEVRRQEWIQFKLETTWNVHKATNSIYPRNLAVPITRCRSKLIYQKLIIKNLIIKLIESSRGGNTEGNAKKIYHRENKRK